MVMRQRQMLTFVIKLSLSWFKHRLIQTESIFQTIYNIKYPMMAHVLTFHIIHTWHHGFICPVLTANSVFVCRLESKVRVSDVIGVRFDLIR